MKKKISIIFGGRSTEHEVSLLSATNIFNATDKEKFEVILIGINKKGNWSFNPNYPSSNIDLTQNDYFQGAIPVIIDRRDNKASIIDKQRNTLLETFDAVFPIIHGTFGEDGTLQGFLKSLNIPFVGPDVLGSSLCMDKDVTKRLLKERNVPVAASLTVYKIAPDEISFEQAQEKLGMPIFVKPCNAGSSVGVTKVTDKASFDKALHDAFQYDIKILLEEAIVGKEIECAVLGNETPKASAVGEIVPTKDFYSYDAKYIDADGAIMKIPAEIPTEISDAIRETAVKAFQTTCCEGLARVDFFLKNDRTFIVNEINTLPGFTEISMYPKLWDESGIQYTDLITRLIEFAFQRHERDNALLRFI